MAVPKLDFRGNAIRGAASTVGSTMLRAQRRAVQLQHPVAVGVDSAGRRLRIHDDRDGDGTMDDGERVQWEMLPEGVRFGRAGRPPLLSAEAAISFSPLADGMPGVTFYRSGAASQEGGLYLSPRTAPGDTVMPSDVLALRVQRSTGKPQWFHFDGSEWREGTR